MAGGERAVFSFFNRPRQQFEQRQEQGSLSRRPIYSVPVLGQTVDHLGREKKAVVDGRGGGLSGSVQTFDVENSSLRVLKANEQRRYLLIQNVSGMYSLYINFGQQVQKSPLIGFVIAPGMSIEMGSDNVHTGDVWVVGDISGQSVSVFEGV